MTKTLQNALDLSKNIFIEACAGAGKTYVLAKRYARILDAFAIQGRHDARNILVITFTKKAAAEMAGRIYQDLNQLLNDEPLPNMPENFGQHLRQADPAYKLQVRASFSQNAISTIDSFCAGILRDHAQLADLDPEFVPQDEADTDRIYQETWQDFLQQASREHDENLKRLMGWFSSWRIGEAVRTIFANRQLLDEWLQTATKSPENLERRLAEYFPLLVDIPHWSQALSNLLALLPDPGEMQNTEEKNYQRYLLAKHELSSLNTANPDLNVVARFMDLLNDLTTTNSGTWRSRIDMPQHSWPKGPLRVGFQQAVKDFIEDFAQHHEPDIFTRYATIWDIASCEAQHVLAKFYLAFESRLEQTLAARKVLSFDEIITRTHQLLKSHPRIAATYSTQFKHIMVDEFQDTNALRWDIIRMIAERDGTLRTSGLFIVGDTKQSIYRFNQADVSVMHRVQNSIESGGGQVIRLNETYRSSDAFVRQIINPLMQRHFRADPTDLPVYDTTFQPTTVARNSPLSPDQHTISRCVVAAMSKSESADPLLLGGSPDVIQTARLAQEMVEWAESKELTSPNEPVVGILLRTFTRIGEYIRVFNRMDVPFQVVAGKGLFKQQEAFDLLHWIRVMINPLDDLALVGLLRSPFFALPDREIDALRPTDRESLWEKLSTHQKHIHQQLVTWREWLRTEPLDRVLESILAEDERLLGWYSETAGIQRVANLERIIHLLHQQSLQGQTLHDIFHYLDFQINQQGDAPQADLPNPAKIQIMTIHKAKGLQFPVVLLPELHRGKGSEKSGVAVERWPEGPRQGDWLPGFTLDSLTGESRKTNLLQFLKNQRKLEEEAEDRRLFYVAVTRSKFALGCLAEIDPEKFPTATNWWGKYIAPHFNLPHQVERENINELEPDPVVWSAIAQQFENTEIRLESPNALTLPPLEKVDWLPPSHETTHQQFAEISPHDLMDWITPGSGSSIPELITTTDEDGNPYALTFGRVLHRALEMGWWDVSAHTHEIEQFLASEGISRSRAFYLTELEAILTQFRASVFFRAFQALPTAQKFPELPLVGWLENRDYQYRVTGILDLLYQRDDGQWVVLDYKSDQETVDISGEMPHPYWFQLQTYLWMVKQSYGIDAVGELYFLRTGARLPVHPEFERYARLLGQSRATEPFKMTTLTPEKMTTDLVSAIDHHAPDKRYDVLEPTRGLAIRAYQTLAAAGKLRPGCVIQSQQEFLRRAFPHGRRLNTDITRMSVADILKDEGLSWGVYGQLADAVIQHLRYGTKLSPPYTDLPEKVIAWCRDHSVVTDQDRLPVSEWDLPPENIPILIDGLFSTNPADFESLLALQKERRNVHFLQDQPQSGWDWEERIKPSLDQLPPENPPNAYLCFSVDEEADQAARQILKLREAGIPLNDMKVAVSSMERYIPAIKRTFADYGLPVTIAKHEPVGERPATHLVLSLLNARLSRGLLWKDVTAIWLHPLLDTINRVKWQSQAFNLGDFNQRLAVDHFVRRQGWRTLAEVRTFATNQETHAADRPGDWRKIALVVLNLLEFMDNLFNGNPAESMASASEWLEAVMTALRLQPTAVTDEIARRTLFAILNTLNTIQSTWSTYGHRPGTAGELYRELAEKLAKEEIKSAPQPGGVEVLGIQETVNLAPRHLLVLGLSEGQFPVAPRKNPYLEHLPFNPWFFNLTIFTRWLDLGAEHVTFYAPRLSPGGESLQPSTFIEYLRVSTHQPDKSMERYSFRHYLETLTNRLLTNPKNHQQIRHNAYLTAAQHDFAGEVGHRHATEFTLSASRLDHLLKCPQRYWYASELGVAALDEDPDSSLRRRLGNFIHKLLEIFGDPEYDHISGFDLLAQDFDQAVNYLADLADGLRKAYHFEGELDLLTEGKLFPLLNDLRDNPEETLLGQLLKWNAPLAGAFTERFFEQAFGLPDVPGSWPTLEISTPDGALMLKLGGKIDRVFAAKENVWAVDYKTGKIDMNDTRDFYTSQLFVYLLALQQQFPRHTIILSYEKLKSLKKGDFGISELAGFLTETHPVVSANKSKKNDIPISNDSSENESLTMEKITRQILEFARPLRSGSFALTTRDEKRACAYCEFSQICRKTTVFHRATNSDGASENGE